MAKNKARGETLVGRVERAIRDAIAAVPGIDRVDETEYCDVVISALDAVRFGVAMRQEELAAEAE